MLIDLGLATLLLRGWQSDPRGSSNQFDQQGTLSRCIFEQYLSLKLVYLDPVLTRQARSWRA